MLRSFKKKNILVMIGFSLTLAACTKEVPYRYEFKDQVLSKQSIDTNAEYLYSASTQATSRTSEDARPYSSGDNKRVKLEWTENSLRVIEMERDARFQDNKMNNKLVLEIPVDHLAYECAKDAYGECTSSETQKTDTTWDKKGSFKLKLAAVKSGELDLLPIMVSQTVGENCYSEVSSQLLGYEIEKNAINFQVERTYKTNLECLGQIESLSDATVSAVYHYSFVKLDSVLSSGFKTVQYPEKDERTFGMFSTTTNKLDVDNNNLEPNHKLIMNHWNPNRTSIDYYLSNEFDKPANKKIKELTHKTVASLNEGLAQAGAKFKINLHDPANKIPGDIRNSMIVLVEDPVDSGVIGYGPQTEDPVTGEIISARTIMFLGVIKKGIKYSYDDILRAKAYARAKAAGAPQLTLSPPLQMKAMEFYRKQAEANKPDLATEDGAPTTGTGRINTAKIIKAKKIGAKPGTDSIVARDVVRSASKDARDTKKVINTEYATMDRKSSLKYMLEAKNCAFAPNFGEMSAGISESLMAKFPDDAKPWDLLTETEKQNVIDIILPEVWVATLIHEMGHNLGLRHNFEGSKDKDNYYDFAKEQAVYANHGIDSAKPSSSVMEYIDDLKALPILGKYDIAALRFAYARKVEVVDQATQQVSLKSIDSTLADLQLAAGTALKEYGYCTDDHVGSNPGCERFDEGSNLVDIVNNHITTYKNAYKNRNFRRGRVSMSLYDEASYANRTKSLFLNMRMNAERYELIKNKFGLSDDHEAFKDGWLKDLKDAAILSGKFLVDVVKTPTLSCAIVATAKPNQIIQIAPIEKLDSDAVSCFDIQLNEKYKIVAQTGKLFRSKKDPKSTNPYMDQIDVRGIWTDKLMALRVLLQRQINVFNVDKYADNYADIAELEGPLVDVAASMMMNEMMDEQTFEMQNGQTFVIPVQTDAFSSHVIPKQIHPVLSRILGVPYREAYFQELIASTVVENMQSTIDKVDSGKAFADAFKVSKVLKVRDDATVNDPNVVKYDLQDQRIYALPSNVLAVGAIKGAELATIIEKVSDAELLSVLRAKEQDKDAKAPEDASEELKAVYALDFETLKAFFLGDMQGSAFYKKILEILPNAI